MPSVFRRLGRNRNGIRDALLDRGAPAQRARLGSGATSGIGFLEQTAFELLGHALGGLLARGELGGGLRLALGDELGENSFVLLELPGEDRKIPQEIGLRSAIPFSPSEITQAHTDPESEKPRDRGAIHRARIETRRPGVNPVARSVGDACRSAAGERDRVPRKERCDELVGIVDLYLYDGTADIPRGPRGKDHDFVRV